jgi:flagellar biosynthesis/type III secretory pathway protein FliH
MAIILRTYNSLIGDFAAAQMAYAGGYDVAGHAEGGHDAGNDAYPAAIEGQQNMPDMEAAINGAFEKGAEKGYNKGKEKGVEKGYNRGKDKGVEKGYNKGKWERNNQSFADGWHKGKQDTYQRAWNAGKGKGFELGKGETQDGFEFVNRTRV